MDKTNFPVVTVADNVKKAKTLPVNMSLKKSDLVRIDMDDIIGDYDDGADDMDDEEYDASLSGYAITLGKGRNWQLAQDKYGYPILIAVKNSAVKAAKGKK